MQGIATAGTFTVTVTNPGGTTSNAASFAVATPQQATQAIINFVNALFSQGVVNGGQQRLHRPLHTIEVFAEPMHRTVGPVISQRSAATVP